MNHGNPDRSFFTGPFPCLIVNADDFGISQSVNEGIVDAHLNGMVTAVSLMATGAAFDHAVSLLRNTPALDVGVHLTLVAEKPLWLKSGRMPGSIKGLLIDLALGRITLSDIRFEWRAQIEKITGSGFVPSHLDSHQHVHALPGVAAIARQLADEYGIPYVRMPWEKRRFIMPPTFRHITRAIGALGLKISLTAGGGVPEKKRPCRPPFFIGFHEGGHLDQASLLNILEGLEPGQIYELMCHPGHPPEEADIQKWHYHHDMERMALTCPSVMDMIRTRNIRLISFKDLAAGSGSPEHDPVLGPAGK